MVRLPCFGALLVAVGVALPVSAEWIAGILITAGVGIIGWAFRVNQKIARLEHYRDEQSVTNQRLEEKIDAILMFLLEGKRPQHRDKS